MKKGLKVAGITAGALLLVSLGAGIGGAGQKTAASEATPTPVPTVTVTAKAEVKTVTVEKTPASCLAALSLAGQGIDLMTQGMEQATKAIIAAGIGDSETLNAVTDKVNALGAQLSPLTDQLAVQVAECKSKK